MSAVTIETDFKAKVCDEIRLEPEGLNRFRVLTPFLFEDGDHLAIVLRQEGRRWLLTDEGHTFMHLTYDIDERDLQRGTRQKVVTNALSAFSVEDLDGELVLSIPDERFGDALFDFVQALLKVSDVSFLSREQIRSTFMEDFRAFLSERVPASRLAFDWKDVEYDPEGKYLVDCRVNGMERPLFIYGLPGDDRVRDATISLLQFERWGRRYHSLGIFEDQEQVNRRVLARFSDICEKQFSNLTGNKDRIGRYLEEQLAL